MLGRRSCGAVVLSQSGTVDDRMVIGSGNGILGGCRGSASGNPLLYAHGGSGSAS